MYFGEESITIEEAAKRYKLSRKYIEKLIAGSYIHASDLTKQGFGILISFENQKKLKILAEHPEYRDKILDFNPSYYYDYCTELIEYHPFHDFIDRYCWLIKLFYAEKEEIKKKKYRLDVIFQRFIINNKLSIGKLSKQIGSGGNEGKIIFHLQKGWYNELVRSLPLNPDFLSIGTDLKGSVTDATSVSWNITQTYYSIYEYTNSLAFLFNKDIDTRKHRTSTIIFNNHIIGKLKNHSLFYPFFLSLKYSKAKGYPKHLNFSYAAYPRDRSKRIQDVNQDIIKAFKKLSHDNKIQHLCLVDFLYEFRVWSNYTGIDTIIKLKNGHLLEYLYKNLTTLNFFIGGISELSAIARLGEKEYLKTLNEFVYGYVLKQPQFEQNIMLIPLFVRHRIYKHLGIISSDLPYLSAMYKDPVVLVDLAVKSNGKDKKINPAPILERLGKMTISEIAKFIIEDWSKSGHVPKTYLEPMLKINNINDMYGSDSASLVILYFLSNASQWHGDVAKITKKFLNDLVSRQNKESGSV